MTQQQDEPISFSLQELLADTGLREREFPVVRKKIFLAHAGVAPIPARAAAAISEFGVRACSGAQEGSWAWPKIRAARVAAGRLLGCEPEEIALLGPTSLGLSLVAHGLPWRDGDEVVYYEDDYPANVYPWTGLADQGVRPVPLRTTRPGEIRWESIEPLLTERTRLVALASCHFLSGYRPDIDAIGKRLGTRGILFCVDGIQTVGAFPTPVRHVDFLSADSHKWMLGPLGAGIFYVKRSRQQLLRPILRGAWNIESPDFLAQAEIRYQDGARRYEPGALNMPGIVGMLASMEMLLALNGEAIAARLLALRGRLLAGLGGMGFHRCGETGEAGETIPESARSGIVTVSHPAHESQPIYQRLVEQGIELSLRNDRDGRTYLRFSPHAYVSDSEIDRVLEEVSQAIR